MSQFSSWTNCDEIFGNNVTLMQIFAKGTKFYLGKEQTGYCMYLTKVEMYKSFPEICNFNFVEWSFFFVHTYVHQFYIPRNRVEPHILLLNQHFRELNGFFCLLFAFWSFFLFYFYTKLHTSKLIKHSTHMRCFILYVRGMHFPNTEFKWWKEKANGYFVQYYVHALFFHTKCLYENCFGIAVNKSWATSYLFILSVTANKNFSFFFYRKRAQKKDKTNI